MPEQEEPLFKDNPSLDKTMPQRRSPWQASLAAINYINEIKKQPEFKVRQTDKITAISLLLSAMATLLCLMLRRLSGLSFVFTIVSDISLGICLFIYVSHRLGVITVLSTRQAALVWQLLKAFTFVGFFITINLALLLSLIFSLVFYARPS